MSPTLRYRILPELLAVCKLPVAARIPVSLLKAEPVCLLRTADELSIVCPEDRVPSGALLVEKGWVALRLEGPFPFSMAGVLASFLEPLAEAKVPIFAISSFDTDYVLIKREDAKRAVEALAAAGHHEGSQKSEVKLKK